METLIKSFLDALSDGFSSVGNDAFGLISASIIKNKREVGVSMSFEERVSFLSEKLERIGRNREKLAKIIIRDGWVDEEDHTEEELKKFAENLNIVRIEFDAEEKNVTLVVSDPCNIMESKLSIVMYEDNSIETEGWTF